MTHIFGDVGHEDEGSQATFIGQALYTLDGQLLGTLKRFGEGSPFGAGLKIIFRAEGQDDVVSNFRPGPYRLGDGRTIVTLDGEANLLRSTTQDLQPRGGGGASFAPTPFASTEAGIQQAHNLRMDELIKAAELARREGRESDRRRIQAEIEAAEIRVQAEIEAAKLAQEGALKLTLIQGANQLAGQRSQQIQQARTLLATTLGQDQIKGAALLQGGLGFGTTPLESFRGQLQGFTNEPTVRVNANADVGPLQGQVDKLREQVLGGAPEQPTIGFKHGGTIHLDKKVEQAILVGEPKEDGSANPEVAIIKDNKITFIPLTGQAPHGGSFDFGSAGNPAFGGNFGEGFEPTKKERTLKPIGGSRFGPGADIESIAGSVAPVFEHLGFGTVPFAARRKGIIRPLSLRNVGGQLSEMGLSLAGLQQLGVNPRLFRLGTGVFVRDQEGNLQRFKSMEQLEELGFSRREIVQLAPTGTELAALRAETEAAPLVGQRPIVGESGFSSSSLGQPIVDPVTGIILPDPAQIASLFRPGVMDPSTLLSLFQSANISEEAVRGRAATFTPQGTATGAQVGFG